MLHERRSLAQSQVMAATSIPRDFDDVRYSHEIPPSTHSRQSSQSTTSDSSPATPNSSFIRGHSRYPSSSSSVTYNPHEFVDGAIVRKATQSLPDVAEEPVDSADHIMYERTPDTCYDMHSYHERWSLDVHHTRMLTPPAEHDYRDDFFYYRDLESERMSKRRKSGTFGTLAKGIVRRIPSITRTTRDRKSLFRSDSTAVDVFPASATPSRASSRSSLRRGAREASFDSCIAKPASAFDPIEEDLTDTQEPDNIEDSEPVPQVKTPLLHPLMVDVPAQALDFQSPLQSPTVAPPSTTVSVSNTPAGTPQVRGLPSPQLSTKPSIASFNRSRATILIPQAEIPPMLIAESTDEWADKLGHANFTIDPEPYQPDPCDAETHQEFIINWERARSEYCKHLNRTSTHYGPKSETYALTQQKWLEIEAEWKHFHDQALLVLGQNGHLPLHDTPTEPAPLAIIPTLDDPRVGCSKFPQLGDEDIVGPMVQAVPILKQPQHHPSKRDRFLAAIGNLQSPMRVLKRSFTPGRSSQ